MNRTQLQKLAEDRVLESEALLAAGLWSGAYYLIGYAVECGLKSCVLAYVTNTGAIFQDKRFSEKSWTHDAEDLVNLAGIADEHGKECKTSSAFYRNWVVVKDWKEDARYKEWSESQARKLFEAVTNNTSGVLPWIRVRW